MDKQHNIIRHHEVRGYSLPTAYRTALIVLRDEGIIRPCPAYNTREKSVPITIDISKPLCEPMISRFIPCGAAELQQYIMEMTDGILDFEYTVARNWPYTYHDRMIEQLPGVVSLLRKDPNSRRAVVVIRRPSDIDMDDPPCLQLVQYAINNGDLDCFVTFRSNDAVKAFFMNAFALIRIQTILAELLNCGVGHYVHTANSFHAYERDWEALDGFLSRPQTTYYYHAPDDADEDGWDVDMEAAIPEIREKVTKQMRKYGQANVGYNVGDLKEIILRGLGDSP